MLVSKCKKVGSTCICSTNQRSVSVSIPSVPKFITNDLTLVSFSVLDIVYIVYEVIKATLHTFTYTMLLLSW